MVSLVIGCRSGHVAHAVGAVVHDFAVAREDRDRSGEVLLIDLLLDSSVEAIEAIRGKADGLRLDGGHVDVGAGAGAEPESGAGCCACPAKVPTAKISAIKAEAIRSDADILMGILSSDRFADVNRPGIFIADARGLDGRSECLPNECWLE